MAMANLHRDSAASLMYQDLTTVGYLGGAPDPGCELTASTSPKNTEKRSKIILYNEYDESEWSSVMTNHDNSQSNIKFSVLFFFPSAVRTHKTPTKNHVFCILFYFGFDRFAKNGSF